MARDREEAEATRKHKTETLADLKKVVADNEAVLKEQANSLDDSRIKVWSHYRNCSWQFFFIIDAQSERIRIVVLKILYSSTNTKTKALVDPGSFCILCEE